LRRDSSSNYRSPSNPSSAIHSRRKSVSISADSDTLGPWTGLLTEWSRDSLGGTCFSVSLSHSLSPFIRSWLFEDMLNRIAIIVRDPRSRSWHLSSSPSRFISLERSLSPSIDSNCPIYELLRAVNSASISARYLTTSICRPQIRVVRKRVFDKFTSTHGNRSRSECRNESSAISIVAECWLYSLFMIARQCVNQRIVSNVVILRCKWIPSLFFSFECILAAYSTAGSRIKISATLARLFFHNGVILLLKIHRC